MGRTNDAFDVSDAAHNRVLATNISLTGGNNDRSPASADALIEGERLLKRIGAIVARLDADDEPSEKNPLSSELMSLRTQYEQVLEKTLTTRAPHLMIVGSSRRSAREVGSSLARDEGLIEFLLTDDKLFTFVVTTRGVSGFVRAVDRADIERRVRLTRAGIDRGGTEKGHNDPLLEGLWNQIIDPIEKRGLLSGVRRLILVPHRSLNYLPFAALKRPANGRHLVEDYSIAHVPSASALVALRSTRSQEITEVAMKGSVFVPFDTDLPGTVAESNAIRRGLPSWTEKKGGEASERALRAALATNGAIHIATHGSMNSINPMFSRIDLAPGSGDPRDDGRLEVYELLSTGIANDLVFLSGCETGLGSAGSNEFSVGEDYATLAQAFLFAGAKSVAATIWRISDEGAAAFAARFYSAVGRVGPVEALAMAQRQMLGIPRYRNPYYWAGYQVSPWVN
jgi:CHAT domain-containing protein